MNATTESCFSEPFDSPEHQRSAIVFCVWIFLATEVMFFGGMFVAYVIYHHEYPKVFHAGSQMLNLWSGGLMTAVLLMGSLLIAIADHRTQQHLENRTAFEPQSIAVIRRSVTKRLAATAALGLLFLTLEFYEYFELVSDHLFPGATFDHSEFVNTTFSGRAAEIYFSLFFCMTGLHALHMFIGISLVAGVAFAIHRSQDLNRFADLMSAVALYWHFVDVVWIFLYPLFYLVS